jgi:hypothetical protein
MTEPRTREEGKRHSITVQLDGAEYRYVLLVAQRMGGSPDRALRLLVRTAMGLLALSVPMFQPSAVQPEVLGDVTGNAAPNPPPDGVSETKSKWAKRYAVLGAIASFIGLIVAMFYIMWK